MNREEKIKYIQIFVKWAKNTGNEFVLSEPNFYAQSLVDYLEEVTETLDAQGMFDRMSVDAILKYINKNLQAGLIDEYWAEIFIDRHGRKINQNLLPQMYQEVCEPILQSIKSARLGGKSRVAPSIDQKLLQQITKFLKRFKKNPGYAQVLFDTIKQSVDSIQEDGELVQTGPDMLADYWHQVQIDNLPEDLYNDLFKGGKLKYNSPLSLAWDDVLWDVCNELRVQALANEGYGFEDSDD